MHDLLRSDVSDLFQIDQCRIDIVVDHDLRSADYTYSYELTKLKDGPDEWNEVFAYPRDQVAIRSVNSAENDGLRYTITELDASRNAHLQITFGKALKVNDKYSFRYSCRTKIESVTNLTPLGGTGSVWYWCAHEFPVKTIVTTFAMPQRVRAVSTHPSTTNDPDDGHLVFEQKALRPREFFMALISYEKRLLGIDPRLAHPLENLFWAVFGAVASIVIQFAVGFANKGGH